MHASSSQACYPEQGSQLLTPLEGKRGGKKKSSTKGFPVWPSAVAESQETLCESDSSPAEGRQEQREQQPATDER